MVSRLAMAEKLPKPTIRGVLFDLDGTLLDTLEDIADSCNAALASMGFPGHEVQAFRRLVGEGIETLAFKCLPEGSREPGRQEALALAIRREYALRWERKTRPYEGVPELLDALVSRGLPLALLSNKPDDFTRLAAQELLGRWHFAAVAGARPGVPKKPDPAGAMRMAGELGIRPRELVYVGDSGLDVGMAKAAGMLSAGALWGFRPWEVEEAGADLLLRHPADLLAFL